MQDKQQFLKSPEQYSYDKIKEDLVFTILEKTLVSAGIYHKVLLQLERKHNSDLHECYRHPKYLSTILKDQFDDSYKNILKSVNQQLYIFSDAESIARFLQEINL